MTALTKQTNSVRFTPETIFGPSRPADEYRRCHRSYIPGAHCCPDEAGLKDTSLISDFSFQLDQHKVFYYFLAKDVPDAGVLKSCFGVQMRSYYPLPCISASAWTALEIHPARAHLFKELTKALDNPGNSSSNADGLIS
jgi:hypothetical protein